MFGGNSKTNPLSIFNHHGIDTDDSAVVVDEGATAIARINWSIRLNHDPIPVLSIPGNHSGSHRMSQARWTADRIDSVSLAELLKIGLDRKFRKHGLSL